MSDSIFVIREGQVQELHDQAYDSERLLQQLLVEHPGVIAGSQIDSFDPRRWLLVSREMPVPGEEDGGWRWSLDHLFLDQDGIPTLIEVKRSSDTRIRREVVGQMLDYAANAVVYWPIEQVRSRFYARCEAAGRDPSLELDAFLADAGDPELFWSRVKTNLQAGRVRMIFVADAVPPDLQRIVEFLNSQMDPAEVLALEIRQYVGDGLRTLVPRVIGRTARAQQQKSLGQDDGGAWDEGSFFAALRERCGDAAASVARRIFDWARLQGRIWYGSGKRSGSFGLMIQSSLGKRYLFAAYTHGSIEIYFQWLKAGAPFAGEEMRRELLDRLNAIDGVELPADAITRRPSIRLADLAQPERLNRFVATLEWAVSQIRVAEGSERPSLA